MGATIDSGNMIRRGPISIELSVFGLFCSISRDSRDMLQDCIAVDCYGTVRYYKVPPVRYSGTVLYCTVRYRTVWYTYRTVRYGTVPY